MFFFDLCMCDFVGDDIGWVVFVFRLVENFVQCVFEIDQFVLYLGWIEIILDFVYDVDDVVSVEDVIWCVDFVVFLDFCIYVVGGELVIGCIGDDFCFDVINCVWIDDGVQCIWCEDVDILVIDFVEIDDFGVVFGFKIFQVGFVDIGDDQFGIGFSQVFGKICIDVIGSVLNGYMNIGQVSFVQVVFDVDFYVVEYIFGCDW